MLAGDRDIQRALHSMDQLDREDKAKELLKEAGWGEGGKPLKIDIRYNTNANHEKVATAVAVSGERPLGSAARPRPSGAKTASMSSWPATSRSRRASHDCRYAASRVARSSNSNGLTR